MAVPESVSLVIEWDNALISEADRNRAMLAAVAREIASLDPGLRARSEVLFVFDDRIVPEAFVRSVLEAAKFDPPDVAQRFLPAPGQSYYQLKTRGVSESQGEIVVLIDCDVLPEPGWLSALLAAFEGDEVHAASGRTLVGPLDNVWDRAFSAFWIFHQPASTPRLVPIPEFYANNLALRRSVAAAEPFPAMPTFRGQCAALARRLVARGLGVYRVEHAAVSHPASQTWGELVNRAMCHGHDHAWWYERGGGGRSPLAYLRAVLRVGTQLLRAWARILRRRRAVGLALSELPAALGIATAYHGVKLFAECLSLGHPRWVETRYRI